MDTKAKARRRLDELDPPPTQIKIEHEIWRIYTHDNKGYEKISSELDNTLLAHIEGKAVKNIGPTTSY
eukprot:7375345-Ditylum_brightwellii.AAC.1